MKRLVVIGSDGMVSLAALRWLADQDAAFVMLELDGSVLATTGPVRPSDARLRRAQATAQQSGAALNIARELISKKLAGQEQVARKDLLDSRTADLIAEFRTAVAAAETIDAIRHLESQGASAYWAAWRDLPINFPKSDLPRVPEHWRKFDTRKSPLTGSQRLAANPANAILNYLYAVLESETRLAVAALGLDPGLGFWHVDTPARDSLACDLMEPVRPQVDAFSAELDHARTVEASLVLRTARRELATDEHARHRTVTNRPDLGSSDRAVCRMGCSDALVKINPAQSRDTASDSFDSAPQARSKRSAVLSTCGTRSTTADPLSRLRKVDSEWPKSLQPMCN